jgi:hypothetical protein
LETITVKDENGNFKEFRITVTDIQNLKNTEEALKESEERYRQIFVNNHAPMLLIDPINGDIVDANQIVKDVPFEARGFLYFSIENKFGEDLTKLEKHLKVWNFEHPDAKAYFNKAVERDDKTYFAVTIEFDYPTYLNEEVVNRLIVRN